VAFVVEAIFAFSIMPVLGCCRGHFRNFHNARSRVDVRPCYGEVIVPCQRSGGCVALLVGDTGETSISHLGKHIYICLHTHADDCTCMMMLTCVCIHAHMQSGSHICL
jgi:hypothetical protein